MHEASIVESLVELVQQNLEPGQRARRIEVRVGLLTGVSPDAMQFYFEMMREDTLGAQAELDIRLEPLRAECQNCQTVHELSEIAWLCPDCGARGLRFQNGDELQLCNIEVDDGQDRNS